MTTDSVDQGHALDQLVGSPPSSDHSALAYMAADSDSYHYNDRPSTSSRSDPYSNSSGHPSQEYTDHERPRYHLTRASTLGTPHDFDHKKLSTHDHPHARSEDLNHNNPPSNGIYASDPSRPSTPGGSNNLRQPSSPNHTDSRRPRRTSSAGSESSARSESSITGPSTPSTSTTHTGPNAISAPCAACGKPMQGAFVRALGTMFHLNCFKCMDCGTVVASKFFPIDGPDGKQHPLCERDYFRRLNLICAKCGQALRGSYITACNKKYHVEHFTCSVCPTLFGPQDSYYEHDGDVYCHYHYSTRFATKCAGCNSAILKQFVEINRNMRDECWHPECYMINKFWNVKVVARRPNSLAISGPENPAVEPAYAEEERRETPTSLKDRQTRMEQQVYRIWTVLSAFEESSAACISDMLRQVSNGQYLEAIRMAEKFILHVEVLFATIDELEYTFSQLNLKGMSHVREARMLCRKTVDLFTLLSHTQETGARRMGMTQELLALVTGLAHYLKILIRIALTGALKLEREHEVREAIGSFLDKLHMLAIQGGDPSAKRMMKRANGEIVQSPGSGNAATQGVTYGFKSLAPENAGEAPFSGSPRDPSLAKVNVVNPPSDLCVKCNQTVEEDCVRLGTYQRWHSHCVQCNTCGKVAAVPAAKEPSPPKNPDDREKDTPKLSTARRPPANVGLFVYEVETQKETTFFGVVPTVILCTDHAHGGCRSGFLAVSRLEQYAYLLSVALRRLYVLLKKRGVVPATSVPSQSQAPRDINDDPYRNSGDINRLKSVHLDRKLSATARVPKRSTIVESPSGKIAHPTGVLYSQRSQELHTTQSHRPTVQQQAQSSSAKLQKQSPPGQSPHAHPARPHITPPGMVETSPQGRPPFPRQNTEVMIVDDSAPTSPAGAVDEGTVPGAEDGITLADIPQIVEAAQAREQHRSLPRQNAIPYIAELSSLELAIIKHSAVIMLQRSPLRDQFDLDEILELVENKKSSFWKQLFKPGSDKNVKKKGVFGIPLELLVEREGADSLHGASRAALRVPSFVDDVVSAMRQMDMSVEGIFRKNGNIRRLKELTEAIDRDPSSVDLSQDNPVQLAALLKKFLRDLPDPLMTFKLHRLFIASQALPNENDRKRLLHMISIILPRYHRNTMEVLFVFLKWVASFAHMDEETGSKMDLGNLATVICPSILYSRGRDAVRDESFGAIRVITSLLENQDEFYCVPEEFMPILHDQDYFASSMDLPSKEFLKKCDTYMRLKASGRAIPMGVISPVQGSLPFNATSGSRPEDARALPPRGYSSPQQQFERPPLGNSSPSESAIRSGNGQSQQTTPPPTLSHSPFSYPAPSGSPYPILAPQSRTPQEHSLNGDWTPPERPPQMQRSASRPSSRPSSYVPPRSSGEGSSPFPPNAYPQAAAVRGRT